MLFTSIHGKKYNLQVTSNEFGQLTINPALFPLAFFHHDLSPILLEINDINNEPVQFADGYILYNCLHLILSAFTDLTPEE